MNITGMLAVREHGTGIPAKFRSKVFEKLTLVMRMHGQVGYEDAHGGGTEFFADLPAADHLARWEAEDGSELTPLVPA